MITERELEQERRVELAPAFEKTPRRPRPEIKPIARRAGPYLVIDRFSFNQARLLGIHLPKIERVARRIALSWQRGVPIREVRLVGHADHTGRAQYNVRLGLQRAEAVKARLVATLAHIAPASVRSTRVVTDSLGASWPAFYKSNLSAEGRSRNRRVEVFLIRTRPPKLSRAVRATPARPRVRVSSPEFEVSPARTEFEQAVRDGDWENAFIRLNGLSMPEMLAAVDGLSPARFDELWIRRATFFGRFDFPRIEFARSVVFNKMLPEIIPGDLRATGQLVEAANFLAAKIARVVPKAENPDPTANISLILQECNYYGIHDKSHIAYVLASAQHESHLGRADSMRERWGPTPEQQRYEGNVKNLGNTQPGDGFRFRGRGFVQITGRANYTFYRDFLLTRGITADLVADPDRATERPVAATILAHGMTRGKYRGPRLSTFGTDCNYDFVQARGIVNADVPKNGPVVAGYARTYRAALN